MPSTCPVRIASEHLPRLLTHGVDPWVVLRDVQAELYGARASDQCRPLELAAGTLVGGLIRGVLDDLTRAIPWDELEILDDVRDKSVQLARESLESLVRLGADDSSVAEFLTAQGAILRRYELLLDSLDMKDREYLMGTLEGTADD